MNTDEEIGNFLQKKRRAFEKRKRKLSSSLEEEMKKIRKKGIENTKTRQNQWKERRKELKIACHNINGLKTREWKLANLLGWTKEEEISILGLTEMNITEKEGRLLLYNNNMQFRGYWANATPDKKKGSVIGVLIDEKWEKHVRAVKRISEYMIEVRLYFRQLELVIIGVYIPPNDKLISKKI